MKNLIIIFIQISRRLKMKILKILLILLVPAIGIVGCKKSDTKPECSHSSNKGTDSNAVDNSAAAGRFGDISEGDTNSEPIVGSGEDDRDGGDKKKKLR